MDNYVIENERSSTSEKESCNERMNEHDVNENEIHTQPSNRREVSSPSDEPTIETQNENDFTNDLENTELASKRGADITVPGISEKKNSEKTSIPRGVKYNLRPNPNPNFTEEYRY